eukprot:3151643-Amphidinium_carterae.1
MHTHFSPADDQHTVSAAICHTCVNSGCLIAPTLPKTKQALLDTRGLHASQVLELLAWRVVRDAVLIGHGCKDSGMDWAPDCVHAFKCTAHFQRSL